jgi:hypothetical protein
LRPDLLGLAHSNLIYLVLVAVFVLKCTLLHVSIPHDKLVTALRTATAEENSLDKEATSYDDILDSYQLTLKNYEFGKER